MRRPNAAHEFCDDFDDRTDPTAGYHASIVGRATVQADRKRARSAPQSMLVHIAAGATQTNAAQMFYNGLANADRVRLAFSIFISPPGGSVGDSFANVGFGEGYFDFVWYSDGNFNLTERVKGTPNVDHAAAVHLAPSGWVRVVFESTPGHVKLTFDDAVAVDEATGTKFTGLVNFSIGVYAGEGLEMGVAYDDVLADTVF